MTHSVHKDRFTADGRMDFAPSDKEGFAEALNERIDQALEKAATLSKPRNYLGGSRLGVECDRQLGFEHRETLRNVELHAAGKPIVNRFPGKVHRRFRLGHWVEDEVHSLLTLAGFIIKTKGADGQQFGFKVAGGKISGHLDGVVIASPLAQVRSPSLWENKVMNSKKYAEFVKKGIKKANPVYYAQMQTYCAYMGLEHWFFTAQNADTSEIWPEVGAFDAAAAQEATDRGVRVLTAGSLEELVRITRDPNDFRCKWCSYRDECWAMSR